MKEMLSHATASSAKILPVLPLILLLARPVPSAAANPPPPDVDAQYAATLAAMKHPAASGILVTEIAPDSPAGAAGLRAGDIIIRLAGRDVRTLAALRAQVADLLAASAMEAKVETSPLTIRREAPSKNDAPPDQPERLTLQVPRRPLGIRAIEVEAGVPAPRNPPPSMRGSITLAWDELRRLQSAGGDLGGQPSYFRTTEAGTSPPTWLGWQSFSAQPISDDTLSAKLEISRIEAPDDKANPSVVATEAVGFTLRTGDFKTAPAFLLESADVVTKAGDGAIVTTSATRAGAILRIETTTTFSTQIEGPVRRQLPCPPTALLPAAVPLLASAMPQHKDAVLALRLMSAQDFLARPGYVLVTRGRQPLPGENPAADITPATNPAATAPAPATSPAAPPWRVDLMHCGVVVESYWFNDQRRLLRLDSYSGTTLVSRRVAGETEARVTAVPR